MTIRNNTITIRVSDETLDHLERARAHLSKNEFLNRLIMSASGIQYGFQSIKERPETPKCVKCGKREPGGVVVNSDIGDPVFVCVDCEVVW